MGILAFDWAQNLHPSLGRFTLTLTFLILLRNVNNDEPIENEDVWITGFSEENVKKCATQYLGCEEKCDEFLRQADESGMVDLLHVPIILLMACVVFAEYKSLPSSKTGVFNKILTMTISRTTLKTMGKTALQIENLEELLIKLGKLAWEALTKKTKQLLLSKVRTIC